MITVKNELPWHWPISDPGLNLKGGRIDVDRDTKQKIENSFAATINQPVRVLDVEEVCNAEFYESYQRYAKVKKVLHLKTFACIR